MPKAAVDSDSDSSEEETKPVVKKVKKSKKKSSKKAEKKDKKSKKKDKKSKKAKKEEKPEKKKKVSKKDKKAAKKAAKAKKKAEAAAKKKAEEEAKKKAEEEAKKKAAAEAAAKKAAEEAAAKKAAEEDSDSDSDDSSDDSDEEEAKPAAKKAAAKDDSDSDSDSDDSSDEEAKPAAKKAAAKKADSDSDDSSSDEEEAKPAAKKPAAKKADSDDDSDDSSSDEEEAKPAAKKKMDVDDDDSSDDDSDDSDKDEEMAKPATPVNTKKRKADFKDASAAKKPRPNGQSGYGGTKTEMKGKTKRCFVGNLNYDINDDAVKEFFKECGSLEDIFWLTNRETGDFKGAGFITFDTNEGADKAVETLGGTELMGRPIKIDWAEERKGGAFKKKGGGNCPDWVKNPLSDKPAGCNTVFLGNLDFNISEEDVKKHFKECGEVVKVRWMQKDGEFKGAGFCEFGSEEAVDNAVKLCGEPIIGRPARVDYAKPRAPRPDY